jgi:hypothetical protein
MTIDPQDRTPPQIPEPDPNPMPEGLSRNDHLSAAKVRFHLKYMHLLKTGSNHSAQEAISAFFDDMAGHEELKTHDNLYKYEGAEANLNTPDKVRNYIDSFT